MSPTCFRRSVTCVLSVLLAGTPPAPLPNILGAQGRPGSTQASGDLVVVDFARAPLGPFSAATAAAVVSGAPSVAPTGGPGLRVVEGALEVVDHLGQRMLRASSRSTLLLTLPARTVLPADFTVAVDLVPKECCQPEDLALEGTPQINQSAVSANLLWRHEDIRAVGGGATFDQPMPADLAPTLPGQFTTVVFTFQGDLVTVYTNGRQVYALPNRKFVRGGVLRLFLGGQNATDRAVYLAGVRVAAGVQPAMTVAAGATGAPTPVTTMAPGTGTAAPLPPPAAASPPTGLMTNTGPVPTFVANLTVTQGPNGPVVDWQPPAAPAVYTIQRWKIDDPTCCNNTSPASPLITAPPWQDSPPPMAGTYVYQVTATTNGGSASARAQFQYLVATGGTVVAQPGAISSGPRTVTAMPTTTSVSTPTGATGGVLPSTFQATVTAGPAGPVVTWTSVPQATGYAVTRSKIDDGSCCNTSSGSLGSASSPWQDQPLPVSGTFLYTVSAATPVGVLSTQVQFGFRVPGGAPAPGSTQPATIVPLAPQTGTATPIPAPAPSPGTLVPPGGVAATPMATGPAPSAVVVHGTPTTATVIWQAVPGATGYRVNRAVSGTSSWTDVSGGVITTTSLPMDVLPDRTLTYTYQVVAYQPDGTFGAASADYTAPPPTDPTDFAVRVTAPDEVEFTWLAVGGPAQYLLSGPGTGTGLTIDGTGGLHRRYYVLKGIPGGTHTWRIATSYLPGGVLTPASAWPSATATMTLTGKYHISVEAVEALGLANDDILDLDGKGNELFVTARVTSYDPSGGKLAETDLRSATHGDITNWPPPARVRAGSWQPNGGVAGGDRISPLWMPPTASSTGYARLELWQGTLSDAGERVEIIPTAWEADDDDWQFRRYVRYLRPLVLPVLDLDTRAIDGTLSNVSVDVGTLRTDSVPGSISFELTTAGDRPIGVERQDKTMLDGAAWYTPFRVVITRDIAERALAGKYGPLGVIPIHVVDHLRGSGDTITHPDLGGGHYVLHLRVARLP